MVEFNNEIPKGYPKLDSDYWSKLNNKENPNNQIDINTNFALKDLSEISVFNSKK